ncbi:MAG: GtrA family protein [Clostridia bacterium]|nr:GtrA family protein [Clostridia bacterium]
MDEKKAGNGTQKLTKKQTLIQTVKFALFSASAGIIQAVTFTLLNEVAHLKYWPSYLTALVLSVLWNFTFNRKFTFKSANNIPIAMLKVAGYYCVFTPLSTYLGNLCAETYVVNEYIVLAVTMVTNLVTEYLFCRFVVYRNSMNTNDIARKEKAKEASDAESKND